MERAERVRRVRAAGLERAEWLGRFADDRVAARTVALVNALHGDGARPAEVAAVLLEYGERPPVRLTDDDVAALRVAADEVREVLIAPDTEAAVARLNALLARCAGPLRLTSHEGTAPWHPHLDSSDDAPWDEWFRATSALALLSVVWERQGPPGAVCAARGCSRVLLPYGAGPQRRYCSRRCATRERVAAHRARTAPDISPSA
ncbi:CGNR zinc finger domain-containing protein [Streptomyces sp. NPDC004959]|uniref:CGNR zinc finger domain-containing protein n=1 Tax=unclassified Streptomyces TaxID=2593676 RepID=UPI0004C76E42|nr:CGNR zinc finger domain-containing protein [Streptomyces sp. NRRL F-5630]